MNDLSLLNLIAMKWCLCSLVVMAACKTYQVLSPVKLKYESLSGTLLPISAASMFTSLFIFVLTL